MVTKKLALLVALVISVPFTSHSLPTGFASVKYMDEELGAGTSRTLRPTPPAEPIKTTKSTNTGPQKRVSQSQNPQKRVSQGRNPQQRVARRPQKGPKDPNRKPNMLERILSWFYYARKQWDESIFGKAFQGMRSAVDTVFRVGECTFNPATALRERAFDPLLNKGVSFLTTKTLSALAKVAGIPDPFEEITKMSDDEVREMLKELPPAQRAMAAQQFAMLRSMDGPPMVSMVAKPLNAISSIILPLITKKIFSTLAKKLEPKTEEMVEFARENRMVQMQVVRQLVKRMAEQRDQDGQLPDEEAAAFANQFAGFVRRGGNIFDENTNDRENPFLEMAKEGLASVKNHPAIKDLFTRRKWKKLIEKSRVPISEELQNIYFDGKKLFMRANPYYKKFSNGVGLLDNTTKFLATLYELTPHAQATIKELSRGEKIAKIFELVRYGADGYLKLSHLLKFDHASLKPKTRCGSLLKGGVWLLENLILPLVIKSPASAAAIARGATKGVQIPGAGGIGGGAPSQAQLAAMMQQMQRA